MNDQTTVAAFADDDEDLSDDSIGASIKIDYTDILADCEPGAPGGRTIFNSGDYETEEEAEAALDAFFDRIIEGRYEENA
jgi:hypothetical protein